MRELHWDLETYSEVPINRGVHAYAAGASILLCTYAFNDDPVQVWDATVDHTMPKELYYAFMDRKVKKIGFNIGGFDRIILKYARGMELSPGCMHDVMVQALSHALPGSLEKLGMALGLSTDQAKDKKGRQLINLFCKPRPKNMKLRRATRDTHPTEWQQFIEYAKQDVAATRTIYRKLPKWNYHSGEAELWHLDQRINDRGFAVDTELAEAAIRAVNEAQAGLSARVSDHTGGALVSANQRDAMLEHILGEYGVSLPDMQSATIERRLNDPELPQGVRELLAIRQQSSKTSTSKYVKLIEATNADGRMRGTLQFAGAGRTRRWAGRTFQPQNLPRPKHKQAEIDTGVMALKADCADLFFDDVMGITSSCIRSCIVAAPGKKLVVSDLSNIEGRFAAWIAGEEWKIKAFRDFDSGIGKDLYVLAYARAFNIKPEQVDSDQRQIGKVMELALGYGGGVGAFLTFAANYGLDIEDLTEKAWSQIPRHIRAEAEGMWGWARKKRRTCGLNQNQFVVCDSLKRMWREAHPAIVSSWSEYETAVRQAVYSPGKTFTCGKLSFVKTGAWLRIILPSGWSLCYPSIRLEGDNITYCGQNQYSRQWERLSTFGGKLLENICQSGARDVMGSNMPLIEQAGYPIVLTVHDEVLTEVPNKPNYTVKTLSSMLASVPEWATGLPLAAAGFETTRYRKG